MPDLKAAAKRLRESVAMLASEIEFWGIADIASKNSTERLAQASSDNLLAAQALEAWAWAEDTERPIECVVGKWKVLGRDQYGHLRNYVSDTPLGAVLSAMEGEQK